MIELYITHGETVYQPILEGNITWETERYGAPGKLTFSVVNDNYTYTTQMRLNIQEGDPVVLRIDGKNIFFGFVFIKSRDKDQVIKITAYDQLRYLKNKDTYILEDWTATKLVESIAADFYLQTGELEDTKYPLNVTFDGDTLFDMITYALQETNRFTGELYVLYDDYSKLALKNINSMRLDYLLTEQTAENFSYETSIDGETYNQIKLIYDNEETGYRDVYLTKDSENIQQWGLLQYYDSLNEKENGIMKAETLLNMYNSKRRTLTVSGAFSDLRVRGGVLIPVMLTLGDVDAKSYLLVEKATHTITEKERTMNLTLRGGYFV